MQFKQQYKESEYTRNDYETPSYIFDPLDRVFGFSLDAAASEDNALCPKFYTKKDNGLLQSWKDEIVFVNCPYTNGVYKEWIRKAVQEWGSYYSPVHIVMLLPASWETAAFEPVWEHALYMIFPYARIKFELGGESSGGAPFSSLIPIFTDMVLHKEEIETLSEIGRVVNLHEGYRCLF